MGNYIPPVRLPSHHHRRSLSGPRLLYPFTEGLGNAIVLDDDGSTTIYIDDDNTQTELVA